MRTNLGKKIEKRAKSAYAHTLMGSQEGIFTDYRMRYLLEHIVNDEKVYLDVGCGAGYTIRKISKHFDRLRVIGLDISPSALRSAGKRDKKTSFIRGDAEQLPIRDNSIDYAISLDLLEHLPNPEKAIREHYRVLKSRGIFHLFTPCEGEKLTIHGRSRTLQSLKMKHFGHIQHFTKQRIRIGLKKAGFAVTDEKHSYFYFAQFIELIIHLFIQLSRLKVGIEGNMERFTGPVNLVRALVRNFISKIDLKLSKRFPNHSKGLHITARK